MEKKRLPEVPSESAARRQFAELLRIKGLRCGYGRKTVLEDISFSLWSGFFCGLLGPNGSGKSTLINNLCRVFQPQAGEILLAGRNLMGIGRQELATQVAVVPQDTHISFPFTVREVIAMGRNPHIAGLFAKGYQEDDPVVVRVMAETGIDHLQDRPITQVSGGERQLVLLARALVQEPKLLLLDEPTSNLDIHHSVKILRLVEKKVKEEGLAVLAIFHDLNLASIFADYLFLLQKGRIAFQGETEDVMQREILEEVFATKLFVHTPPMIGRPQVSIPTSS
ncbi:MAG: ABC transporter ATP-binding protein [Deltaproteobacteria bacterium]|nr:ABC transporter ATP-binding protein [Candidatus Anaeroferrophillus wilburensis]MBN2889473.1 ABC transporter ATP-binding protein [Deltaproteobacteria bacterium]